MTREGKLNADNLPQEQKAKVENWFRNYSVELRQFIVRNMIQRTESDDLLHDVFVVALTKMTSYRETGHARAYLYRIAKNLILSRHRKNRRQEKTGLEQLGLENLEDSECELNVEQGAPPQASKIQSHLASLGSLERVVVRFRIEQGMAFKKIAEILECPLNTVISCFHRAIIKLRKACT